MDTTRSFTTSLITLILTAAMLNSPELAKAQAPAGNDTPYIAIVNQDEIHIRSGNSEGHYPIGKAKRGEFVRVVDEKYEWAQVQTIGPVFERFHGLVMYPDRFADRLKIAADGKSARTLGRIEVNARNPSVRPGESWKMIAQLEANETIQILESGRTERGDILHTIVLPQTGKVWIKKSNLRKATAEEQTRWKRLLAGEKPEQAKPKTISRTTPQPVGTNDKPATATPERVLARDTTSVNPVTNPPAATPAVTTNQPAEIVMQPGPERKAPNPVTTSQRRRAKNEAEQRFDELESMYALLQNQPIESAEINPLRHMYIDLAEEFSDQKAVNRFARARSEQLQIWGELQLRRAEMNKIKSRLKLTTTEAKAIRQAMDAGRDYAAMGRLTASVIYDGVTLPRLLRLQDPMTGRTIAYLQPSEEEFEMGSMVNQLIGIVGKTAYDGGLRLNLITPDRIDLLTANP